jgi:hypothetical protein
MEKNISVNNTLAYFAGASVTDLQDWRKADKYLRSIFSLLLKDCKFTTVAGAEGGDDQLMKTKSKFGWKFPGEKCQT